MVCYFHMKQHWDRVIPLVIAFELLSENLGVGRGGSRRGLGVADGAHADLISDEAERRLKPAPGLQGQLMCDLTTLGHPATVRINLVPGANFDFTCGHTRERIDPVTRRATSLNANSLTGGTNVEIVRELGFLNDLTEQVIGLRYLNHGLTRELAVEWNDELVAGAM